jgi:hypothetical protein
MTVSFARPRPRHSGESRNPSRFSTIRATSRKWIPAFAGMTGMKWCARLARERA